MTSRYYYISIYYYYYYISFRLGTTQFAEQFVLLQPSDILVSDPSVFILLYKSRRWCASPRCVYIRSGGYAACVCMGNCINMY